MDGGRPPTEIGGDQVAFLTNATCRGGFLKHRPGYVPRPLAFGGSVQLQLAFEEGLFQCAHPYISDNGRGSIVVAISGKLFKIDIQQSFAVSDISITGDLNPSNRTVGWMVQAENYLVFQDNQTTPLIFNGASSRRATNSEIRPGSVMAVSNGRIWYALPGGTSFRATDIVRGPSGTPANRYRDAILKETENTFLNEGGDFSTPGGAGEIRAMVVPANLDTSLGQGPLQVLTTKAIFSVNAPTDRTTWKDVTYPIVTDSLINFGALGPRSAIAHNGDIFYRSKDGFRSFVLARREFGSWGNTPISGEMRKVFKSDQQLLLRWGSSVQFNNRLLLTTWPRNSARGVIHPALSVLNFDLVSVNRKKAPPSWEGVWTGLNILQVLNVEVNDVERCFAFVVNQENKICLWEITADDLFDDTDRRITWGITSRSFTCNADMSLKRIERSDVFVDELVGVADFSMQYRPDGAVCWQDWHQWSECATFEQCTVETEECQEIKNFQPQYRPKMRLPQPETICNPQTNQPFHDCFEVQLKLTITGSVRIRKLTVTARDRAEDSTGSCPPVAACKEVECCNDDPLSYTSEEIDEP